MFKRKRKVKSYRFYRKRSKKKKGSRFLDLGIALLGILTILFVLSSVKRLTQTQAEGSLRTTPLRIQVLNASGQRLNPEIIKLKIEEKDLNPYFLVVVEQKDFSDSLVKESLLLDRMGGKGISKQVAEKLGLKRENILLEKLEGNYLNISYTLILGQDYQKLLKLNDQKEE
ncbi:MAG TPA: hypothetical protein VGB01_04100 [candidate division Zixibacteria bacterium]